MFINYLENESILANFRNLDICRVLGNYFLPRQALITHTYFSLSNKSLYIFNLYKNVF